jgi:hypothetical protein
LNTATEFPESAMARLPGWPTQGRCASNGSSLVAGKPVDEPIHFACKWNVCLVFYDKLR